MPMLALVVGLLALPFVIAGGLYFLGWQPARTGNHGQIVSPPLPLPASGLRSPDGRPLATAALQDKWLLLLNGNGRKGPAGRPLDGEAPVCFEEAQVAGAFQAPAGKADGAAQVRAGLPVGFQLTLGGSQQDAGVVGIPELEELALAVIQIGG